MKNIIFVCHGNICRSVAAEYIAKKVVNDMAIDNEFNIISRAVSNEEIGNDIYPPMKDSLTRHNIPFSSHKSTKITKEDYAWADYIFYMDTNNIYYLNQILLDTSHKLKPINSLFDIEDPWYTGRYDYVTEMLIESIKKIFDLLIADCPI